MPICRRISPQKCASSDHTSDHLPPIAACAKSLHPCQSPAIEIRAKTYPACQWSPAARNHMPAPRPTYLSPLLPNRSRRRHFPHNELLSSAQNRRTATIYLSKLDSPRLPTTDAQWYLPAIDNSPSQSLRGSPRQPSPAPTPEMAAVASH